jgi:hypothetical protein
MSPPMTRQIDRLAVPLKEPGVVIDDLVVSADQDPPGVKVLGAFTRVILYHTSRFVGTIQIRIDQTPFRDLGVYPYSLLCVHRSQRGM